MTASQLRVYLGRETDSSTKILPAQSTTANTITLPLGDVLPLLADAVATRRTWLRDFEDDQITVSSDLYEVLLAYQQYRQAS